MLHRLYNSGEKMALKSRKHHHHHHHISRSLLFFRRTKDEEEEEAQNVLFFFLFHKQNPVRIYPHFVNEHIHQWLTNMNLSPPP